MGEQVSEDYILDMSAESPEGATLNPPEIKEIVELKGLIDYAKFSVNHGFRDSLSRCRELEPHFKEKRELISSGLAFPDHPEVIAATIDLLTYPVMNEMTGELLDIRDLLLDIAKENIDVIKFYASDENLELASEAFNFAGKMMTSTDPDEHELGLEVVKSGLESENPAAFWLTNHLLEEHSNGFEFSIEALKKMSNILEDHKKYIRFLVSSDDKTEKDIGINLCLAAKAYEVESWEYSNIKPLKDQFWVEKTLEDSEVATVGFVLDKIKNGETVPDWYLDKMSIYLFKNQESHTMLSEFWGSVGEIYDPEIAAVNLLPGVCSHENPNIRYFGYILFEEYLKKFNLDDLASTYMMAWERGTDDYLGWVMLNNLQSIIGLEQASPGLARRLTELQGVKHFSRYPIELLIEQDDIRDKTDIRYGVFLFPEHDHNGAFYANRDVFKSFYDKLNVDRSENNYGVRIYERGDRKDIARLVKKLTDRYGPMSFAIMGAHGSQHSMLFGEYDNSVIESSHLKNIRPERHNFFTKDASLVLISCSTGREHIGNSEEAAPINMADSYSKAFGVKVIAPREDTNIANITPSFKESGVDFSVEYQDGKAATYDNRSERGT